MVWKVRVQLKTLRQSYLPILAELLTGVLLMAGTEKSEDRLLASTTISSKVRGVCFLPYNTENENTYHIHACIPRTSSFVISRNTTMHTAQ